LQWLATENFDLPTNALTQSRLERRCARAGRSEQTDDVVGWLRTLLQTRLPGLEIALPELTQMLPEMEFWLPSHALNTRTLDQLCCTHLLAGIPRAALPERQLQGMLMGFTDLVFEHQGRYWVLDYKGNYLGNSDAAYTASAMAQTMAQHRYDVQAALYLLALHRLLQARLGANYQPEMHLGGAIYWFIRGVQSADKGVLQIPYTPALLDGLNAWLQPSTPGAAT
jgi:exodeoxyribonuclease V beta subunit